MKKVTSGLLLAFSALVASGTAWAQDAEGCVPSPTNMPNAGYPRVCPDHRVIFKLEAPQARKVQLEPNIGAFGNGLGEGIFDMVRSPDGVWSLTLGPVRPGFHYYHFLVDGLAVGDPGSNTYTVSLGRNTTLGLNRAESGLEVLETGVDFFLPKDVPHGVVEELWYKAKTTGEYRRAFVYVPPGYDMSLTTRYPVLYLQHGGTQDETSWVKEGHISAIMDNLLAEKKIVPMLVVMERGYGTMAQTSAENTVPYNPGLKQAFEVHGRDTFAQLFIKDLVPLIDGRYRTMTDREHRAIAGLSGGAEQALQIGVTNLDKFSYIGVFSGPSVAKGYLTARETYSGLLTKNGKALFAQPDELNAKLNLLWFGDGTAEANYKDMQQANLAMEQNGLRHVYYEVPGTAHEWATWRRHLYDFAPRLFRDTK